MVRAREKRHGVDSMELKLDPGSFFHEKLLIFSPTRSIAEIEELLVEKEVELVVEVHGVDALELNIECENRSSATSS